jgi:CubicO group peptidase (beta-lactamase class C family)
MMWKLFATVLIASRLCSSPAAIADDVQLRATDASPPEFLDGFEEYVDRVLKTWHIPGATIGVVRNGRVVYVKAFGDRHVAEKTPVTVDTLFPIGSITKSFTATGLGMLADDGKLDWDAPIRQYMPEFRLYDTMAEARTTTRDLLTHRTGVASNGMIWWGSQKWLDENMGRRDVLRAMVHLKPTVGFRTKHQYSNENYIIAGLLFEVLGGMTWEEFTETRVLAPLGMDATHLHIRDIAPSANLAHGHYDMNGKGDFSLSGFYDDQTGYYAGRVLGPAGTIVSNVHDMLKWLQFHINRGRHGKEQLLSVRSASELIRPQVQLPDVDPRDYVGAFYGMGFVVAADSARKKWVQHVGLLSNCTSLIGFMPAQRDGVIILTNWTDGFGSYSPLQAIVENLKRRFLGKDPKDYIGVFHSIDEGERKRSEKKKLKRKEQKISDTRPSHAIEDYVGVYEHPVFQSFEVYLSGGELRCRFHGREGAVTHYHYDIFEARLAFGSYLPHFKYNRQGEIDRMVIVLEASFGDIEFVHVK